MTATNFKGGVKTCKSNIKKNFNKTGEPTSIQIPRRVIREAISNDHELQLRECLSSMSRDLLYGVQLVDYLLSRGKVAKDKNGFLQVDINVWNRTNSFHSRTQRGKSVSPFTSKADRELHKVITKLHLPNVGSLMDEEFVELLFDKPNDSACAWHLRALFLECCESKSRKDAIKDITSVVDGIIVTKVNDAVIAFMDNFTNFMVRIREHNLELLNNNNTPTGSATEHGFFTPLGQVCGDANKANPPTDELVRFARMRGSKV